MLFPTVAQQEAQIRAYAISKGIDPDVAVRVARSEGLQAGTWQSNVQQPYGRERSYGAFQLHVDPTGKNPGLGNQFQAATGLDPSDPANWEAMNRYALDQAAKGGWSPWMGAKKIGVTGMMGVGKPATFDEPNRMSGWSPGLLDGQVSPMQSSASPTQGDAAAMDWAELAKAGEQLFKKSQPADEGPDKLPPPPPVLQPLRRISLGKGLLG